MTGIIKKMLIIVAKIVLYAALIICATVIFFRHIEVRTLFYPTKELTYYPNQSNLGFEDVFFKASDGVNINGWFIPAQNSPYTILFAHGNAGNIGHRMEKLEFFHSLGYSVFIFDYRGYGKSEGKPSEAGLYKDAEAAYRYLVSRGISGDRIIGYGESIGGAVIVDLASKLQLKAVILDSTLSSVKDMVNIAYPFVPHWIFATRFDSETKITYIKIPKLMIHSIDDEIIPFALGKKLYEAAAQPKIFLQIRGGHNTNFFDSAVLFRDGISSFLAKLDKN